MEVLLGLPHLTSLQWDNCAAFKIQRWYTDSQQHPCRWEELTMDVVSAHNLARLPLHSLKQPVSWNTLSLHPSSLQEVRAAVANVTRSCPAGFTWHHGQDYGPGLTLFEQPGTQQAVAGALVTLQPLLAPLESLGVRCRAWDVELVKVLGRVLPRTCTCLELRDRSLPMAMFEQLASSMSWLATLQLWRVLVSPQDVVQYVRTIMSSTRGAGGVARPTLSTIKVKHPVRLLGMSEVQHKRAWEEAVREVQRVSEGAAVMSAEMRWS